MKPKDSGLLGQCTACLLSDHDDFLCLNQKCRDKQKARQAERKANRDARVQKREDRKQAAEDRKEAARQRKSTRTEIRTAKQAARLDRLTLKNDAQAGENERMRAETHALSQVMNQPVPTPASPSEASTNPVDKIPQWVLYVGGGALLLLILTQIKPMKGPGYAQHRPPLVANP